MTEIPPHGLYHVFPQMTLSHRAREPLFTVAKRKSGWQWVGWVQAAFLLGPVESWPHSQLLNQHHGDLVFRIQGTSDFSILVAFVVFSPFFWGRIDRRPISAC